MRRSAIFGRNSGLWSKSDHIWQRLARVGPASSKFGRIRPRVVELWPDGGQSCRIFGETCARFGDTLIKVGHRRANAGQVDKALADRPQRRILLPAGSKEHILSPVRLRLRHSWVCPVAGQELHRSIGFAPAELTLPRDVGAPGSSHPRNGDGVVDRVELMYYARDTLIEFEVGGVHRAGGAACLSSTLGWFIRLWARFACRRPRARARSRPCRRHGAGRPRIGASATTAGSA